jgi:hypothetical protein
MMLADTAVSTIPDEGDEEGRKEARRAKPILGVLQSMLIVHCMSVCYSWVHSLPAIQQPMGKGDGHGGGVL